MLLFWFLINICFMIEFEQYYSLLVIQLFTSYQQTHQNLTIRELYLFLNYYINIKYIIYILMATITFFLLVYFKLLV